MIEMFGWIGTVSLLLSLTQDDMVKLRKIHIICSVAFVIQAILLNSLSLIVVNATLIFIDAYKLLKKKNGEKKK